MTLTEIMSEIFYRHNSGFVPLTMKLDDLYISSPREITLTTETTEAKSKDDKTICSFHAHEVRIKFMHGKTLVIHEYNKNNSKNNPKLAIDKFAIDKCSSHTFKITYYKNNNRDITDLEKMTYSCVFDGYYEVVDKDDNN